jgi:hypothetical protein
MDVRGNLFPPMDTNQAHPQKPLMIFWNMIFQKKGARRHREMYAVAQKIGESCQLISARGKIECQGQ